MTFNGFQNHDYKAQPLWKELQDPVAERPHRGTTPGQVTDCVLYNVMSSLCVINPDSHPILMSIFRGSRCFVLNHRLGEVGWP